MVFHHITHCAQTHLIILAMFIFESPFRVIEDAGFFLLSFDQLEKVDVSQDSKLGKFCNNLESKSQCVNMTMHPILWLQKGEKVVFSFVCVFTHGIFWGLVLQV